MGKVLKIVAIVAAIAVAFIPGVNAAVFGALATTFGVGGVATFASVAFASAVVGAIGSFGIMSALGFVGKLLGPSPPKQTPSNVDRLRASLDVRAYRKIVFGYTAMGTDVQYQEFNGGSDPDEQEYCQMILVTASHKVQSIEELWLNDEIAWSSAGGVQGRYAGYLTVTTRTEGTAANAFSIPFSSSWVSSNSRMTGCAYLHIQCKLTGNSKKATSPFAGGVPTRMTIRGRGAMMYDPRLDSTNGGSGSHRPGDQTTWAWVSDDVGCNPALQILWYLLGWEINSKLAVGRGIPISRINLASFITAANICDENVTLAAGGTEKRYRSNGVFSEGDDSQQVISNLLAACNGMLRDDGGQISLELLVNDLASPVLDLTADDVQGAFTWIQTPSIADNINVVRGKYTDPSNTSLYQQVEYPDITITSIDGIERTTNLDLPFVQSAKQAQRLAKTWLQRQQFPATFAADFLVNAWRCKVGSVVRFTFPALGFSNKLFRVVEHTIRMDGVVPMLLREENSAIYAWSAEETAEVIGTPGITYNPLNNPLIANISDLSDETVLYRTKGAPDSRPWPVSLDVVQRSNGSMVYTLTWDHYAPGAKQPDNFVIFYSKTANAPTKTDPARMVPAVFDRWRQSYTLEGAPPSDTYSFGIAAARRTENGLEIGAIVSFNGTETYTNLLLRSQAFNLSEWVKTRCTVSVTDSVALDGSASAETIIEDTTASNNHFFSQNVTLTVGQVYRQSIYVKAAGRQYLQIAPSTNLIGITTKYQNFDLVNGALALGTGDLNAKIWECEQGWYRISVDDYAKASGSGRFIFCLLNADTGSRLPSYTGDGASGFQVWGAQLEAPNFLTSANDFSNAAWGKQNCTAPKNATDPFGNANSANTLTRTATGDHYIYQTVNKPLQGSNIRFCVWIKSGTMTGNVDIKVRNESDSSSNLGTLTVTPTSTWTMYTLDLLVPEKSEDSLRFIINPVNNAGSAGDTLLIAYPNAYIMDGPAPYVATTTIAVTQTGPDMQGLGNTVPNFLGTVNGLPADVVTGLAPGALWEFRNSDSGWGFSNITRTNGLDSITIAATTTDPQMAINGISIDGSIYTIVRARIKRTAGSGWDGSVFYGNGVHGYSGSYYKQVAVDPTTIGQWVIVEWDMSALNVGGTDWTTSTITSLRLDLGAAIGSNFEIDWITVGKPPTTTLSAAGYLGDYDATKGATWGTNLNAIPYNQVLSSGTQTSYDVNGFFSMWSGTYPDGWDTSPQGAAPTKETALVKAGPYAAKFVTTASTNQWIRKKFDWSSNPLPLGSFIEGSYDVYINSRTSGKPGVTLRLYTTSGLLDTAGNYVDTDFNAPINTTGVWQHVPMSARVGAAQQIYGMTIFVRASYNGFASSYFVGTCTFGAVEVTAKDNTTNNSQIVNLGTGIVNDDLVSNPSIQDNATFKTQAVAAAYNGAVLGSVYNSWIDVTNGTTPIQVTLTTAPDGAQRIKITAVLMLKGDGGAADDCAWRCLRNGSQVGQQWGSASYPIQVLNDRYMTYTFIFWDESPSVNTSYTYKLQYMPTGSDGFSFFGNISFDAEAKFK